MEATAQQSAVAELLSMSMQRKALLPRRRLSRPHRRAWWSSNKSPTKYPTSAGGGGGSSSSSTGTTESASCSRPGSNCKKTISFDDLTPGSQLLTVKFKGDLDQDRTEEQVQVTWHVPGGGKWNDIVTDNVCPKSTGMPECGSSLTTCVDSYPVTVPASGKVSLSFKTGSGAQYCGVTGEFTFEALPTSAPTEAPTKNPTWAPTKAPTKDPTFAPTDVPTPAPTTKSPTWTPTDEPSASPSSSPTTSPSSTACDDGLKGGDETDVDCGGGECKKCATTKKCVDGPRDCVSGVCVAADEDTTYMLGDSGDDCATTCYEWTNECTGAGSYCKTWQDPKVCQSIFVQHFICRFGARCIAQLRPCWLGVSFSLSAPRFHDRLWDQRCLHRDG